MLVSQSEIYSWTRCRRNWFITYYLGFVPADEAPVGNRQLGSRVHTALEAYFGYQLDPVAVLALLYRIEANRSPEYAADLSAEADLAEAMVSGYLEWLAEEGADADFKIVATETDLRVDLPGVPGVQLRARMDQVSQRISDGALLFRDYKTGANFEIAEQLRLNPQMKFYTLVQHLASGPDGPKIAGGTIDTLRRVKRTGKAVPPYYQRDAFLYTPEEIDATLRKVQTVAAEITVHRAMLDDAYRRSGGDLSVIDQVQRSQMYPTEIPNDCKWWCIFREICPMMNDGSDWSASLVRSGRFRQADPYSYYRDDALRTIREEMEKING
jgi:RecB family exonuclease